MRRPTEVEIFRNGCFKTEPKFDRSLKKSLNLHESKENFFSQNNIHVNILIKSYEASETL